jgi:hypothetical protein
VTVIGSGTSLEGDRWVPGTDGDDSDPVTVLEVETRSGHHSRGGYGSRSLAPGWRLATSTGHDDLGPRSDHPQSCRRLSGEWVDQSGPIASVDDPSRQLVANWALRNRKCCGGSLHQLTLPPGWLAREVGPSQVGRPARGAAGHTSAAPAFTCTGRECGVVGPDRVVLVYVTREVGLMRLLLPVRSSDRFRRRACPDVLVQCGEQLAEFGYFRIGYAVAQAAVEREGGVVQP